jgi:DNA-directed RNA polymerase subunit RPC12/RpoP
VIDRYITSSRYREERLRVECPECEEWTLVKQTTEYGTSEWDPERCSTCGTKFTGDERAEDDEPEPPEPDDYDEYGRFEPWV